MIKIFACGDVVNYGNETGLLCDQQLANVVSSADLSICNFEAPVKGYGSPQPKSGPHLQQDAKTLKGLKEQGFDLVLLANNHMMDYGTSGLIATIEEAVRVGLKTVGAGHNEITAYQPLIQSIDGIKVGIINGCEAQFGVIDYYERKETSGYAWINHSEIDLAVINLKKECDFVLVFAHAGLENYSIPQKEWRYRYKHLCNLGADAVIGSHPHVPQGYEEYNGSLIFYSLGNFYFDYGYAKGYENHSYSVMLELEKGSNIKFKPIHHITKSNKVHLHDVPVDLDALCNQLGEGYLKEHERMMLEAYRNIVERNLIKSISKIPHDNSIRRTIKEIAATLIGKRRNFNKEITKLHFIRNETYQYVARHALETINAHKHD